MPTSTETITRDELLRRAFRRIGVEYPSQDELILAAGLLRDKLRELDAKVRHLHAIDPTPSSFVTIVNQRSYGTVEAGETAGSRIASGIYKLQWIEQLQGATSRRPIRIIYELEALSNIQRETTGIPYFAYLQLDPVASLQRLHLFPTPNGVYTINYTFRRRLYDFVDANGNPDMPPDWNQRLAKLTSAELAPEYGINLNERQLLTQDAEKAMEEGMAAATQTEEPTPRPTRSQFF